MLVLCFRRADPHPGNLFLMDDGEVGLVDFGFFHQLSTEFRNKLCHVVLAVANRDDTNEEDIRRIGQTVMDLGVVLKEGARQEAASAKHGLVSSRIPLNALPNRFRIWSTTMRKYLPISTNSVHFK